MSRFQILLLSALLLCLGSCLEVSAQQRYKFRDSLGTYRVEFEPHREPRNAEHENLNVAGAQELRFGTAYNPYTLDGYAPNYVNWLTEPAEHPKNTIVCGKRWFTLNGDYGYWPLRWLYVGGVASWTGGFSRVASIVDHSRVDCYNYHSLSIMPVVRFGWLNRDIVQLYSGFGVGPMVAIAEQSLEASPAVRLGVAFDVTFIGIAVGRKWFGYFDIGAGVRGTLSAGFGYRFHSKR